MNDEWMNLYFTTKKGSKTVRENNLQDSTVDKNAENENTQKHTRYTPDSMTYNRITDIFKPI